jgi:uncharacterized protein
MFGHALPHSGRVGPMKLWLDADATPRDVKDIVFRAADRLRLETVLVANQRVPLPLGYATLTAARVEHTAETVGERLSVRDFADALRGAGVETGGPRPFGPRDKQAFASALDRVLTRARRRA